LCSGRRYSRTSGLLRCLKSHQKPMALAPKKAQVGPTDHPPGPRAKTTRRKPKALLSKSSTTVWTVSKSCRLLRTLSFEVGRAQIVEDHLGLQGKKIFRLKQKGHLQSPPSFESSSSSVRYQGQRKRWPTCTRPFCFHTGFSPLPPRRSGT